MTIERVKVLGQSDPAAGVLTDLYAAPAGKMATVSSIIIANRAATETSFRVSVAPAGAADAPEQYIYYDIPLPGNDTFIATIGISIDQTDVIRVRSADGSVSFSAFGAEVT